MTTEMRKLQVKNNFKLKSSRVSANMTMLMEMMECKWNYNIQVKKKKLQYHNYKKHKQTIF